MDKKSVEYRNPRAAYNFRIDEPEITLKNYRGIFHMRSSGNDNIELMESLTKLLKTFGPDEIVEHLNTLLNK